MESRVNYTIVGLFVVVLAALIVLIGLWIAWQGHTSAYRTYAVYMEEAAIGLEIQAPVKFNGVTVGYVKEMSLDPRDPLRVRLLLDIKPNAPITESTVATLTAQGITGLTYIGLRNLTANAPPLLTKPGQPYPVIKWSPSFLVALDTALQQLTDNFKSVTNSLNQLLTQQNQESIKTSLANIAQFTNMLVANSQQVQTILRNTADSSHEMPQLIHEMHNTLIATTEVAKQLTVVTQDASAALRDSRNVAQGISQQALPTAVEAINQLNQVLGDLEQLSSQLQANPSIVVRGSPRKPLGPGEK